MDLNMLGAVCDEVEARMRAGGSLIQPNGSVHADYLEALRQVNYTKPFSYLRVRPVTLMLVKAVANAATTGSNTINSQGDEIFLGRRIQGVIGLNAPTAAGESGAVGGVTLWDTLSVRDRILYKGLNARAKLTRGTTVVSEQANLLLSSICPEAGGVPIDLKAGDFTLPGGTQLLLDLTLKVAEAGGETDYGFLISGVYLMPVG